MNVYHYGITEENGKVKEDVDNLDFLLNYDSWRKKIMLPSALQGIVRRKDYHTRWLKQCKEDEFKVKEKVPPAKTEGTDQIPFQTKEEMIELSCGYPKKRKTTLLAELDRDRNYLKELLTNENIRLAYLKKCQVHDSSAMRTFQRIWMESMIAKYGEETKKLRQCVLLGLNYLEKQCIINNQLDHWRSLQTLVVEQRVEHSRKFMRSRSQEELNVFLKCLKFLKQYQFKKSYRRIKRLGTTLILKVRRLRMTEINRMKWCVLCDLYDTVGNAYINLREFQHAVNCFSEELVIGHTRNLPNAIFRALDNVALVLAARGNYNKAAILWKTRLASLTTDIERAWVNHAISQCCTFEKKNNEALYYAKASLKAAKGCKNYSWQTYAYLLMAHTHCKFEDNNLKAAKENLERAMDCLDRAFICSACTGDPHTQFMVFNLYKQVEDRVNEMSDEFRVLVRARDSNVRKIALNLGASLGIHFRTNKVKVKNDNIHDLVHILSSGVTDSNNENTHNRNNPIDHNSHQTRGTSHISRLKLDIIIDALTNSATAQSLHQQSDLASDVLKEEEKEEEGAEEEGGEQERLEPQKEGSNSRKNDPLLLPFDRSSVSPELEEESPRESEPSPVLPPFTAKKCKARKQPKTSFAAPEAPPKIPSVTWGRLPTPNHRKPRATSEAKAGSKRLTGAEHLLSVLQNLEEKIVPKAGPRRLLRLNKNSSSSTALAGPPTAAHLLGPMPAPATTHAELRPAGKGRSGAARRRAKRAKKLQSAPRDLPDVLCNRRTPSSILMSSLGNSASAPEGSAEERLQQLLGRALSLAPEFRDEQLHCERREMPRLRQMQENDLEDWEMDAMRAATDPETYVGLDLRGFKKPVSHLPLKQEEKEKVKKRIEMRKKKKNESTRLPEQSFMSSSEDCSAATDNPLFKGLSLLRLHAKTKEKETPKREKNGDEVEEPKESEEESKKEEELPEEALSSAVVAPLLQQEEEDPSEENDDAEASESTDAKPSCSFYPETTSPKESHVTEKEDWLSEILRSHSKTSISDNLQSKGEWEAGEKKEEEYEKEEQGKEEQLGEEEEEEKEEEEEEDEEKDEEEEEEEEKETEEDEIERIQNSFMDAKEKESTNADTLPSNYFKSDFETIEEPEDVVHLPSFSEHSHVPLDGSPPSDAPSEIGLRRSKSSMHRIESFTSDWMISNARNRPGFPEGNRSAAQVNEVSKIHSGLFVPTTTHQQFLECRERGSKRAQRDVSDTEDDSYTSISTMDTLELQKRSQISYPGQRLRRAQQATKEEGEEGEEEDEEEDEEQGEEEEEEEEEDGDDDYNEKGMEDDYEEEEEEEQDVDEEYAEDDDEEEQDVDEEYAEDDDEEEQDVDEEYAEDDDEEEQDVDEEYAEDDDEEEQDEDEEDAEEDDEEESDEDQWQAYPGLEESFNKSCAFSSFSSSIGY